jgi:cytochrome c biogenesis protein
MSAVEETRSDISVKKAVKAPSESILTRFLALLSSVRFGIILLVLLVIAAMIGMLIMQQNVEGFEKYYAELTPSQKLLYGSLGFFDIYHSWYFNALLLTLSLNIVLASIDRFPTAWRYITRKKLDASRAYLLNQEQHATLSLKSESLQDAAERIGAACRSFGLKPTITEKNGRAHVFAERGAWNRLGAYAVHVALLTIFLGGFLTANFERTGQMPLKPGETTSQMTNLVFRLDEVARVPVELPFSVTCTDIQQKLIRKDGPILASNTLDWLTRIKIKDEYGEREALVHLNDPYDYRGYRFFQASFHPMGSARHITLRLTPQNGGPAQEVTIKRDGSATLPDGTRLDYVDFFPDFRLIGGKPASETTDYNNPAAQLTVTTPAGERKTAFAFAREVPDGMPVGAPVAGYRFRLVDFEKVSLWHTLQIQKDPGKTPFYVGGALLILTLAGVFFFSHQRVWAIVEARGPKRYEVVLGGHTNRNKLGFEDRFKKLVVAAGGHPTEVKRS